MYILEKKEKSKISNLSFHLRSLELEEQYMPKTKQENNKNQSRNK